MLKGIARSLLLAACLTSSAAFAGQDAPLPQPAPQDCSAAEYRRLDFKIGEFEVTAMTGVRAGESRVESVLGGCMLVEHWQGAISGHGQAILYYNRNDQRWRMTFVNDEGDVLNMTGTFAGDSLVLTGENTMLEFRGLHRMTWSPLPEGGVKQSWEYSTDDGASWKTIHVGYYARRR
jgi:hypothetical protein